jgi:hypothetical protein
VAGEKRNQFEGDKPAKLSFDPSVVDPQRKAESGTLRYRRPRRDPGILMLTGTTPVADRIPAAEGHIRCVPLRS